MGGEAHGKPVNLLLTLPYDEPKELLDKWRHSDLNVQSIKYIDVRTLKDGVPKGEPLESAFSRTPLSFAKLSFLDYKRSPG